MSQQARHDLEPGEPEPDPELWELPPEIPEADAIEQHQPVGPEDVDDEPESVPMDVPEADALEQARVVPIDDEP